MLFQGAAATRVGQDRLEQSFACSYLYLRYTVLRSVHLYLRYWRRQGWRRQTEYTPAHLSVTDKIFV